MTRDEILAMKPGRELDALVAEKVMGYTEVRITSEGVFGISPTMPTTAMFRSYSIPDFSTSIADSWRVIQAMIGNGWLPTVEWEKEAWQCIMGHWTYDAHYAWGNTAPEAICKAALLTTL